MTYTDRDLTKCIQFKMLQRALNKHEGYLEQLPLTLHIKVLTVIIYSHIPYVIFRLTLKIAKLKILAM